MNLKDLAIVGVLTLSACEQEAVKPTPVRVSPKVEVAKLVSPPQSSVLDKPVVFEAELKTQGFQEKFKQACESKFAKLPPEERTQAKVRELLEGLASWVNAVEPKGAIQRAIAAQFPGQKVNVFDITKILNGFLHADGVHLMLEEEKGVWTVRLYAFTQTETVEMHDDKRSENYPVLLVDQNLCGTLPERTEAQADPHSRVILSFTGNQAAADQLVLTEVGELPQFQKPNEKVFVASQQKNRLHHEATHLFLLQEHPEIVEYKTCVADLLETTLRTGELVRVPGCYNTQQIQELCAFSSQLEQSSVPWDHLSYLNDDYAVNEANRLFSDLLRIYTLDELSPADRAKVEQGGRIDGEQLRAVFGSGAYSVRDTNAVGHRGYETCLRLTDKLSTQAKREEAGK